MTDITTRLLSMSEAMYFDRSQDELDALLLEAKEEIERLRKALEEIVGVHGSTPALSRVRQIARAELRRAALIPSEQKGDADGETDAL